MRECSSTNTPGISGIDPFGPKTPTPSYYRAAMQNLNTFNERLESCEDGARRPG